MASYYFSVQVVKRSAGRSVIAMAAYRAGERLHNVRRDVTEDYSHRRGVVHREIMAPDGSASWLTDRETLWNAVEAGEKRVDAQLARELNVALPHELTPDQRLELIRGFIAEQFVSRGMVADLAIHEPVIEKGDNPLNHRARSPYPPTGDARGVAGGEDARVEFRQHAGAMVRRMGRSAEPESGPAWT